MNRGAMMTQQVAPGMVANPPFMAYSGAIGGFNDLGGLYCMGDSSIERRGEVLPSVRRFINAYTASPPYEHIGATNRQNLPPPAADDSLIPTLKGKVRDLLEPLDSISLLICLKILPTTFREEPEKDHNDVKQKSLDLEQAKRAAAAAKVGG